MESGVGRGGGWGWGEGGAAETYDGAGRISSIVSENNDHNYGNFYGALSFAKSKTMMKLKL